MNVDRHDPLHLIIARSFDFFDCIHNEEEEEDIYVERQSSIDEFANNRCMAPVNL